MFEVISTGKGNDSRKFANRIVAMRWADVMRRRGYAVSVIVK
jgi:hypothetical protein